MRLRAFRRVEIVLSKSLPHFSSYRRVNTGLNHVVRVPNHTQNKKQQIYGYNLVSMQRLLLVWRLSDMCSCGCRGWCSLHVIMRCLAWSFDALAAGQRPRVRHDGTPFTEREAFRAAHGATSLPVTGRVLCSCIWTSVMEVELSPLPVAQRRLTNWVGSVLQVSSLVPTPTKLSRTTMVHVPIESSRRPSTPGWTCTGSLGLASVIVVVVRMFVQVPFENAHFTSPL